MKRYVCSLVLFLIIFTSLVSAGGVGISPAYFKEFFEPGLERTYNFYASNSNPEESLSIYVKGDLSEYVELSKTSIRGGGRFTVTLKLPDKIEKPGPHEIYIGVIEAKEINEGFGGIAAVQARINILVPYPGKYAESKFTISDINEGENANYEIEVQNLGSEELLIKPKIEIYKNMTEKIMTVNIKETKLQPKNILTLTDSLETTDFKPGVYQAIAIIDWGGEDRINKTFRVGEFLIEITNYDYMFEENRINRFNIEIENKWNSKIDEVFATVGITDNGKLVGTFKTVSVDTNPWEIKNLTGYFDTTGLTPKRYIANIMLSYNGKITSKLVAIYVNESPRASYIKYIIIALIVALIIISAFIYLILKIKKLKGKNEKKKKEKRKKKK